MNVAIFSPSQNPYSETFIQAHKNYLKGNIFYFYGSGSNIQLEGVGTLVTSIKVNQIKFKRKILNKPYNYIKNKIVLDALKEYKIDIILIEYGNHAFQLKEVLELSECPVIVHFHGVDASSKEVIERCDNYKNVFKLANKIIAVSKVMEQSLLDLGCPRDKLVYNVYGPQPEFLKVSPNFSKKQFIGIGRFVDKKAPYYTILAFKEVIDKYPEAKLFLAGIGGLLESCINLVKYLNLEANVFCLGIITPEEYRKYLDESLAFVQHSITANSGDMEGTPLAILEASAAGLPVISTKHAGIPDVIIDNETGLLSNEHDVKTMAANMMFLLNHTGQAKKMGSAGKINISKHFSLERHIDVIQNIINDLMSLK